MNGINKNLFKHNISFTQGNEFVSEYTFNNSSLLNTVYYSETIYNPIEKGIKYYKDLMDKIEPFLYYLGSKYQNIREWDEHNIRFMVDIYHDDVEGHTSLFDNIYKLISYLDDKYLELLEKWRNEDIENQVIEGPFGITVSVYEEYINRIEEEYDEEEHHSPVKYVLHSKRING